MKFLKLDKKKGSGGPSIKSRYAYLIYIDDIAYLPTANEKGVRLEGDILLKEDCTMMPLYLTSSSQEFSYDILGDDDEKSYLVKFSGNHPGTELEALEFAKNMIEQPFLVLIPSCNEAEPWKLLGELTNPLIFTSSHKGGSDSSKFTFNFEQRIGSEFIYFSYGGVEVPSDGGGGVQPPDGGFDPAQWAKVDASNIDPYISQWRAKLGVNSQDRILTIGAVTATTNKAYLALPPELKNEVEIGMVKHSRTVAQQFPFTAVTTGFKVLIIEARPTPEVFHLVEGTEGTEAVEPAHTGLVVAKLLATPTGTTVEESNTDFKQKLEDYWLNWYVTSQSKVILSTYDARGSFYITKSASATGSVTIGGLSKIVPSTEDAAKIFYEGREFWIYNATGEPMLLNSTGVSPIDTFLISDKLTPFTVKNNTAIKVKLRGDILEILPSGSDPDLSGYATTEQLATKLTKPATIGTFAVQFDGTNYSYVAVSGENISNANMTWAGNTTQNLNGKTLYFTGSGASKFKLDYLYLEPKATIDTIPNKIGNHNGVRPVFVDKDGIPKDLAFDAEKVSKPTLTSDFSSYPNIVAIDDLGNSAKVPAGTIDVISMFFDYNVKWFFPNPGITTYITFRTSNLTQSGQSSVSDYVSPCVNYSSSGSALGFQRGSCFYVRMNNEFITERKFTIRTAVATQRIFVGISCNYGVTNPTNIALTSQLNSIGICMQSGDNKIYFFSNDNSGTPYLEDTEFVNNTDYYYKLTISSDYPSIKIKLVRINKSTLATEVKETSVTKFSQLPSLVTQFPVIWCADSLNSSVVTVGDYGGILLQRGIGI